MTEQYKKHTHREHVLELPDTYIGSVETSEEARWVFDAAQCKMVEKNETSKICVKNKVKGTVFDGSVTYF